MQTNLINLMSKIKLMETELTEKIWYLQRNATYQENVEISTGKTESMKIEKTDFGKMLDEVIVLQEEISKTRQVILTKNNTLTLSNGYTIQTSLSDIKNKRELLQMYKGLLTNKPNKVRKTDGGNNSIAYYQVTKLDFDVERIKLLKKDLENYILSIESEISTLNSQTFEI